MEVVGGFRRVGWSLAIVALAMGCGEDWTHLDVTPAGEAPAPVETVAAAEPAAEEAAPATAAAPVTSGGKPSGTLGTTGGSGFLWKPVSESNGRLVVLIPAQYTGRIASVFLARRTGTVIEQGSYVGIFNGGRAHYWFSAPGSSYGSSIFVVADLEGGTSVNWFVPNGGARTEY
jgi:hypothetical protein